MIDRVQVAFPAKYKISKFPIQTEDMQVSTLSSADFGASFPIEGADLLFTTCTNKEVKKGKIVAFKDSSYLLIVTMTKVWLKNKQRVAKNI